VLLSNVFLPARRRRMSDITITLINKSIERFFKNAELDKTVIDHVLMLVNRHIEACKRFDIEPEINRTVIEAVEDYRLKQTTGISAIDRAPNEAAFPVTRFLQYLSPRKIDTQKKEE
jgi:hypothetical protein